MVTIGVFYKSNQQHIKEGAADRRLHEIDAPLYSRYIPGCQTFSCQLATPNFTKIIVPELKPASVKKNYDSR